MLLVRGRRGQVLVGIVGIIVVLGFSMMEAEATFQVKETRSASAHSPSLKSSPAAPKLVRTPSPEDPPPPRSKSESEHLPGEVLVKFKKGPKIQSEAAIHAEVGAQVLSQIKELDVQRVRGTKGQTVEKLIEEYSNRSDVEYVEPNLRYHIHAIPNDPRYPELWGLNNIGQTLPDGSASAGKPDADIDAPEAWEIQSGKPNVLVAVIDTGVDYTHPDLAANIWTNPGEIPGNGIDDDGNGFIDDVHGWDFVNDDNDPMDNVGHGTHVAGTIAGVGNNGLGVVGVAWQAKIMPLKFLGPDGGTSEGAARAILYASRMGAQIANNSWGCGPSEACFSKTVRDAIETARQRNMLVVASAGNDSTDNDLIPTYPCNYFLPNVICVAATDSSDRFASAFSNWGKTSVHLGAPGVSILSTVPTGACELCNSSGYRYLDGTSMAAPHVSGAAALLRAQYPALKMEQIKSLLLSVDPVAELSGRTLTGGRLNVNRAIRSQFALGADPFREGGDAGGSVNYTMTIYSLNGFNGPVSLSMASSEPSLAGSFTPAVISPSPNGTATATLTLSSRAATPAGRYRVTIRAISSGESHAATVLFVVGTDLAVDFVAGPAAGLAGREITVEENVVNHGTFDANGFYVGIYLSKDEVITPADLRIGTRWIDHLPAGQQSRGKTPLILPPGLEPGLYRLGAFADDVDQVSDSRLANNGKSGGTILIGAASPPAASWEKYYGEVAHPGDGGRKVLVDRSGSVYVVGTVCEKISCNFAAVKYDALGNFLWSAQYDGGGDDAALVATLDGNGHLYIAGWSCIVIEFDSCRRSTGKLVKYDGDGNLLRLIEINNEPLALRSDSSNNIYLLSRECTPLCEVILYRIVKYDSNGRPLWSAAPRQSDSFSDLDVDPAGNVFATGSARSGEMLTLKYDAAGKQVWSRLHPGASGEAIKADKNGKVFVAGALCAGIECLTNDYLVIQYDSGGNLVWSDRYDHGGDDVPYSLAVDPAGNLSVTGFSENGQDLDFATLRYDNKGNRLWVARYHSAGDDIPTDSAIDLFGRLHVIGYSRGATVAGSKVTYNPDGTLHEVAIIDHGGDEFPLSIAVDLSGNVYLSGVGEIEKRMAFHTIKYAAPFSDLLPASLSGPNSGAPGEEISLFSSVKNQGGIAAGPFSIGFYLSTRPQVTSSDLFLGRRKVGPLEVGAKDEATVNVLLPAGIAAGKYTLGAIVDDQEAVSESNERNNTLMGNIISIQSSGTGLLFSDDFNRTTGMGASWKIAAGNFTTDGSQAVSSGTTSWAYVAKSLGTNDYTVESALTVPSGSLFSGIVARGNPATGFYNDLYTAQLSTQGSVNLYRRNAGTWTLLKGAAASLLAGRRYLLKLKVSGTNPVRLEVSLDGTSLFTYSDTSASRLFSGAPGIENYNSGVKYDYFTVSSSGGTDVGAPSAPAGLAASGIKVDRLDLSWNAATDRIGVQGYKVFRNGSQVAISSAPRYTDTALSENTTYIYTVSAFDAAGNESSRSVPLSVKTAGLKALGVSPSNPVLGINQSMQFSAVGTYTDGSSRDLTRSVTWSSSDNSIVFISNSDNDFQKKGLANGLTRGEVTIAAFDSTGNIGASTTMTIKEAPVAQLSVNPAEGSIPLIVRFDGSTSFSDTAAITAYRWDFGDGTSGTGRVVNHTYVRPGLFMAKLTVTNDQGISSSREVEILACAQSEFCDSFNRAITTDLGSNWNEYLPDLQLNGTEAYADRVTDVAAAVFKKGVGPNQSVSVDCKVTLDDFSKNCGVMARWSNGANFYYAWINPVDRRIGLSKIVAGVSTLLASKDYPLEIDHYYRIHLVVSGPSLSVFLENGTSPAISVTDASLADGNFSGIRALFPCCADIRFENFVTGSLSRPASTADNFNRPNTTNLGPNWNETHPELEIFSNQIRNVGAGTRAAVWAQAVGSDQEVSVDCKVTKIDNSCAIMSRWSDASHFYRVRLDVGRGNLVMMKTVNGVITELGSASRPLQYNVYYRMTFVATGSNLSVFFADETVPMISANDTALTGTFAGIRSFGTETGTNGFDNFEVRPAGGTPPVNKAPTAKMSATPISGVAPLKVHFDGSTSSDPDGSIVSHAWNFGDGTTGAGSIVDHTYTAAGSYTAKLTVTDNEGATHFTETIIRVGAPSVNQKPLSRISLTPASGAAPLVVRFDGSTSSDPDGSIVGYAWNFGDGSTGSGSMINHTYTAGGTYAATLTVTDNNGATGASNVTITVTAAGSTVLFDDPFNRTTGLGSNWKIYVGSFSTDGSHAVGQTAQNWAAITPTLNRNDYTVKATLTVPAGSLYSGIVARGNPSTNFYTDLYAAQIATNGTVNLYRRNSQTWTLLKSAASSIVANQAYTLSLKVSGSNPVQLEVSLDGRVLFGFADSSVSRLPTGIPGVQNYNTGVKYDRFTVTAP